MNRSLSRSWACTLVFWPFLVGLNNKGFSAPLQNGAIITDSSGKLRKPTTASERKSSLDELSRPRAFDSSASSMSHFGSAKQASTWMLGPESNNLDVQVVEFEQALGKDIGTSPWHVVSPRHRPDSTAVTLWGASLFDAYRFVVDGDRFEATDRSPINRLPVSIPWNFVSVDNGRFIVPDPDGHRTAFLPRNRTSDPTLLVFSDSRGDAAMKLETRLTISEKRFREICGVNDGQFFKGGTFLYLVPTFSGGMATTAVFRFGNKTRTFLVILDKHLQPIAAAEIGELGIPSNDIAAEELPNGSTAFYIATDDSIVKMVFDATDATDGTLSQRWARRVPVRRRLGTTPSLMNTPDGEKFVLVVDAKAAVVTGLNGLIATSPDGRRSNLIAVRREDDVPNQDPVLVTPLPQWLTTVENSPAVRSDVIAIANYSGYLPNGLIVPADGRVPTAGAARWGKSPDSKADFASGVVVLQYDHPGRKFNVLWQDPQVQFSGVPTISGGSNMLYGTGAEPGNKKTYFYGYRLLTDQNGTAGQQLIRQKIGDAPFREIVSDLQGNQIFGTKAYRLRPGEIFDAGNNLLILEDRSVVISGGRGLVRIRDSR